MAAISSTTFLPPAEISAQINAVTKQIEQGEWRGRDGALSDKIDHLISNLLTLNSSKKEESAKILSESCSSLEALRKCLPTTTKIRTATLEALSLLSQGKPLSSEQIEQITQRLSAKTDANIQQSLSIFRRLKEILVNIWHALANWIGYNRIPLSKLELSPAELTSVMPHLTYLHLDKDLEMSEATIQELLSKAAHLQTLKIETNSVTKISRLPTSLKNFECHSESLTEITALTEDLETCDVSQCENLDTLPAALPNHLVSFNCSQSKLHELPRLNDNLKQLRASYCPNIQSASLLSTNPSATSLDSADFSGCQNLVEITSLPSNLDSLNVEDCSKLQTVDLSNSQKLRLYARGASQLDLLNVSPQVNVIR